MSQLTRKANPEILYYLYEEIPKIANRNELFVKIFGEDFVSKKIRENLLVVYSNQIDFGGTIAGYHVGSEKSITSLL